MGMTSPDTEFVHIDGSRGEGGGQIVRSSMALAIVSGRPVRIDRIRAGRRKPGLKRQHLTAVNAAAEISGGTVSGAAIGSSTLTFQPQSARAGDYHFRIGTAGSATLVLQTVLPPLLTADGPSTVLIEGGTNNEWAPPFDFLARTYLPLINRMGPRVTATLERHGFYPAGGGRFRVSIAPAPYLTGFDLLERGAMRSRSVRALVANLPRHIGEREVDTIVRKLRWSPRWGTVEEVESHSPGNVVFAELEYDHVTEVFAGFGRQGIRAERVAANVVKEVNAYLKTDAPVHEHLADQLLLPLGISAWQEAPANPKRGGAFRTLPLSPHTTTHIDVLRAFLGIDITTEDSSDGKTCEVRCAPCGGE